MCLKGKCAILVVSFGTSYDETRKKTIDEIENCIAAACPQYPLYRAWSSERIREKLKKRDNTTVLGVKEALEKIYLDGIRSVVVQPTYVIDGLENKQMTEEMKQFQSRFDNIAVGAPLLTSAEDKSRVIQIVAEAFHPAKDEALVLMGHGAKGASDTIYETLDAQFKAEGYFNIFVGSMRTSFAPETLQRRICKAGFKKVTLAPFMIVAGKHAYENLSGEAKNSWKSVFEREGCEVNCVLRGLGEYPGVRRLFLEHMERAMDSIDEESVR